MVFQVQQESLFHQTTKGLARGPGPSRFPARNPSRDALSSNFEQVDATHSSFRHESFLPNLWRKKVSGEFPSFLKSIPEGKLIWKPGICSCPNLEPKIRSL